MHELNIEASIVEFYEAWNRRDETRVLQMLAPNAIDHTASGPQKCSVSFIASMEALHKAFPDLQYKIQELAIDSKRQLSAVYLTCEGTQESWYMGVAPTGRRLTWREMRMARWHDGRVVDVWTVSDSLAVMVG